jgi:hypothetical protein
MESSNLKDLWLKCCKSPNVEKKSNYGRQLYIHIHEHQIWFAMNEDKSLTLQGHTEMLSDSDHKACVEAFDKTKPDVKDIIKYIEDGIK